MDVLQLIIRNKRERYELELEFTEDETTKNQIQSILQKLEKPEESKIDKFDNKIDQIELLSMKKQFYRLKEPQKINRLEKYFTEKHNIYGSDSKIFANQIVELLNNSTLKSKDIEYDPNNAVINNILGIEFVTTDNKIEIKLITKPKKVVKKRKNLSKFI